MVNPIPREQIRTAAAAWRAATVHLCEQIVEARVKDEFMLPLHWLEDVERWADQDALLAETMLRISTERIQRLAAMIQKFGGPAHALVIG